MLVENKKRIYSIYTIFNFAYELLWEKRNKLKQTRTRELSGMNF